MLFATLVAFGLRVAEPATVWLAGGLLAAAMVLAAGALRSRAGYWLGSALQVPMLVGALAVPAMLLIGGIFVVLWVVALRLGARIDAERAGRAVVPPG